MKEHVQKTGVRKYAGDDLIELQAEPLAAVQGFFEEYGNCIIRGCEVVKDEDVYHVTAGLLALQGNDPDGDVTFKVVPFSGIDHVTLPLYFTLTHSVVERAYGDGKVKPIAYDYYAVATSIRPDAGTPYLEITATGGRRFIDAVGITQKLDKTGNGKDVTVTFAQATDKTNITSGDKLSVLFGKVRKWFATLGNLAFKNTATIAEVDHLQATLDTKANASSLSDYILLSQKGASDGVATLDAAGKIVTSQLPLGETSSTAYRGDRGKIAYDYSQGKRSKGDLDGALQTEINNKLGNTGKQIITATDEVLSLNTTSDIVSLMFLKKNIRKGYIGLPTVNDDIYIVADNGNIGLYPYNGKATYNGNEIVTTNDARLSDARPANGGNSKTVGDGTMTIVPFGQNGINFGGTGNYSQIYIGHSATDSKPIPTEFVMGGETGTATVKAGNFLLAGKQVATTNQIPTTLPASDVYAWAKAATKSFYAFDEIGSFTWGVLQLNTAKRTRLFNSLSVAGYQSWVAIGATRRTEGWGRGLFSVGTNDAGTTFTDFEFDVNGRIYSPAGTFALTSEIPTKLPAHGGNADTLGLFSSENYLKFTRVLATVPDIWNKREIIQLNSVLPDGLDGVYAYGTLISLPGNESRFQLYAPHRQIEENNASLYFRTGFNEDKKDWVKVATIEDIPTRTDQIAETNEKKYITPAEKEKLSGMLEVICAARIGWDGKIKNKKGIDIKINRTDRIYDITHNYGSTNYIVMISGDEHSQVCIETANSFRILKELVTSSDVCFIMYKI